jgi:hypothetical protein
MRLTYNRYVHTGATYIIPLHIEMLLLHKEQPFLNIR